MKTITIRNVPPKLARRLQALADEMGLSPDATALRIIEERLLPLGDGSVGGRLDHDLDRLSGSWTREEAEAFNRALAEMRRIDRELWD